MWMARIKIVRTTTKRGRKSRPTNPRPKRGRRRWLYRILPTMNWNFLEKDVILLILKNKSSNEEQKVFHYSK